MLSACQRGALVKDSSLGSWAEERRLQLTAATSWVQGSLGGFGRRHPWVPHPSPVHHQSRCCWGSEVQFELEGVSLDNYKQ